MIVVRLSCDFSEVVVWSSYGLRGCLRALEDRSAWSVIMDGVGGWAALCFTDGFLCVAVCLRGTAQLGSMLVLYRSVARPVDAAQRL